MLYVFCWGPASAEKWISNLECLEGEMSTGTQDALPSLQYSLSLIRELTKLCSNKNELNKLLTRIG